MAEALTVGWTIIDRSTDCWVDDNCGYLQTLLLKIFQKHILYTKFVTSTMYLHFHSNGFFFNNYNISLFQSIAYLLLSVTIMHLIHICILPVEVSRILSNVISSTSSNLFLIVCICSCSKGISNSDR